MLPLFPFTTFLSTSVVNVSVSPSDWFTVRSGSQVRMQCRDRTYVQTACFLTPLGTESCQQLQERALGALTPWSMSVSQVGRVEDTGPFTISEWVPIVTNGMEVYLVSCSHQVCSNEYTVHVMQIGVHVTSYIYISRLMDG